MPTHSVSIIVPAYNEERRLPRLLAALERDAPDALARAGLRLDEVIIVDDGSTDGSAPLLDAYGSGSVRFAVVRFESNRGKGAAVGAGAMAAGSDRLLVTDVDLSVPLEDVAVLARVLDDGADVAIASRSLPGSNVIIHQPRYRELMGKTFNLMLRALTGLPYRDTQCGFKLFRRDAAHRLFALRRVDGFAYDAELCVNARSLGLRVAEVPVRWRNDPQTHVALVWSSVQMALDLLRIAWRARRPLGEAAAVEATPPRASA